MVKKNPFVSVYLKCVYFALIFNDHLAEYIVFVTLSFSTLETLFCCLLTSIVAAEKTKHGLYSGDKGEPLEGFEFSCNLMSRLLEN